MFLGRSDDSPSMRQDWREDGRDVYGISADAVVQENAGIPDIVNSVSGIYGSHNTAWFTSYIPWLHISGVPGIGSETFTTGVAVGRSGYFDVDFYALGASVDLDQKTWRGALLELNGDGSYYVVDRVVSATPGSQIGTLYTTAPLASDYTGEVDLLDASYQWTLASGEYYLE
jgi:hypothetical protein